METISERSKSDQSALSNGAIQLVTLIVLAIGVCLTSYLRRPKNKQLDGDTYLTARGLFSNLPMIFSFFVASGCGWALPSFIVNRDYGFGIIGVFVFSVATSVSYVVLGYISPRVVKFHPSVMSWNDFARKKFGKWVQALVLLMCYASISMSLCAEYTSISDFLELYHIKRMYTIVSAGIITSLYMTLAGFRSSVYTDVLQVFLWVIVAILALLSLRSVDMKSVQENKHFEATRRGYESIFTFGIGTIPFYVFSDIVWQRVAATGDSSKLREILNITGFLTFLSMTFIGIISLISMDRNDPNSVDNLGYVYSILGSTSFSGLSLRIVRIIVLICFVAVDATVLDSYHVGISDTLCSFLYTLFPKISKNPKWSLNLARIVLVATNIVCMWISTTGNRVASFFTLSTILCCTLAGPLVLSIFGGIFDHLKETSVIAIFLLVHLTNFLFYVLVYHVSPANVFKTYYFEIAHPPMFLISTFAPYIYTYCYCKTMDVIKRRNLKEASLPEPTSIEAIQVKEL